YKRRMEKGLSFLELGYQLLQAYDFLVLYQDHACKVQLGGDDQWGNILSGVDLIRRVEGGKAECITWPLLTTAAGQKMGKTARGAVWLDASKVSPYEFYQYWINTDDSDAGGCLRMLTELAHDQIESLDAVRLSNPGRRDSQRRLAEELTRLVHGAEGLAVAQRATEIFFGAQISDLNDAQLTEIFADVPSNSLSRSRLSDDGLALIDALVESGLAKSKAEARRTIQQGGAYVNNRRVEDVEAMLTPADLASETVLVLRSGKKKYALLRFT
ncbi:MAG: tyrosine--tRNA ligase, partial [Planctomycetes bacterium]|nr:tyrosine--tRNA ligase [Planctomycetota bacterium]